MRGEYFISNFDFYQPEAYIPGRDLYIDKMQKQIMKLKCCVQQAMNSPY